MCSSDLSTALPEKHPSRRTLLNLAPQVRLTELAEKQLRVWTMATAGEFSCFGVVEKAPDSGLITVTNFFLPKQSCTDVHTRPDRVSMGQLMTELVKAGQDVANLRCWAHSHAEMQTFWSSEDTDSISQMDNGEWLLSIVTNKAGSFKARLDLYEPFRLSYDDLPLLLASLAPQDEALVAELNAKLQNELPDYTLWPKRHVAFRDAFDVEACDFMDTEHDEEAGILLDLQDCGLTPHEAATLVQAVKAWPGGDLQAFWALLLGSLPELDFQTVDAWGILDVFAGYSLLPNDLNPLR